jgi:hypothetical protein
LGAAIALGLIPVPGVAIPETAYVWQRAWTPEVRRAVAEHAASFDQLDVLAAEVNLPGGVALPCIDWPTVRALRRPVALVVRIQHSPPNSADKIVQACREIWMRARAAGVTPAELQIDFDCASSRLAEYVALVKAIRPELRPPRLVVTALPDWLTQPAFHPLAFAVDAFVLQVHSVARPNADQPLVLCDPIAAQQWIRRASLVGRPFRVALPDYGYEVGFDSAGCYLGLAAEGENRTWPKGAAVRSGLADPAGIAALVRTLRRNPPPHLIALSWFRLPTSNDVLCWSWPTLAAVRRGELPQTRFDVRLLSASSGASDIIVVNTGEGFGVPPPLALHLKRRDMLACDLDPDWHSQQDAAGGIFVRPESSDAFVPLRAGERRRIGWLRLAASSHDTISK